ncbi:MAG: hypothetical protein HYY84_14130 [Deltaproteobacteria bacterium]|nr:hypothetical protein [Deltaproteobacteria bacterium]
MSNRFRISLLISVLGGVACGSTPYDGWPNSGPRSPGSGGTDSFTGTPAPAPEQPASDMTSCSSPLRTDYEYEWSGGMRQYYDSVNLIAPNRIRVTRSGYQGHPRSTCETTIRCANAPGEIASYQVYDVLSNPDVQAAFNSGGALYGVDSRPWDGVVFVIRRGASEITVGGECGSWSTGCTPVPAGLRNMVTVLDQLYLETLGRDPCLSALP